MFPRLAPFVISAAMFICQPSWCGQAASERSEDPWIGRDKVSHLALSLSVVGFGYHVARMEGGAGRCQARTGALGVSLALGLAKEFYDRKRPGPGFSYRDLVYDLMGSGLGLLLFTLNR